MYSAATLVAAALFEIAGCFGFWAVTRLGHTKLWLLPSVASLCLFAYLLTLTESAFAGRTFAIYGGIYIAASLAWMRIVEDGAIDRYDVIGATISIIGAMIILLVPRGT